MKAKQKLKGGIKMLKYLIDRNDYVVEVSDSVVAKLIEMVGGVDVNIFEGTLKDNYIFWNTVNIEKGIFNSKKYIIVKEICKNHWTSELVAIITDNINLVERFHDMLSEEEEVRHYNS